jgi:hypothetical protein
MTADAGDVVTRIVQRVADSYRDRDAIQPVVFLTDDWL